MIALSVIVCPSRLGAEHLRRVLEALRTQTLPLAKWEILLIGETCEQLTGAEFDISWHPNVHRLDQCDQGTTPPRETGIRQAVGTILVFADECTLLAPDYLVAAVEIGYKWPRIAVWGSGETILEFEVAPPSSVADQCAAFAYCDIKVPRWSNVFNCGEAIPAMSGLCVRAEIAKAAYGLSKSAAVQFTCVTEARLPNARSDELSYAACKLGFGVGIFPQLKQTRIIPKEQATKDYLLALCESERYLRYLLIYKWQRSLPPNPLSLMGFLLSLKRFLLCRGFQRRMYLAELRATLRLHQSIAANQAGI
jgi:hypothetical protein